MKRQNIEVVLGFLDAIRRRDREAAGDFLDPEIVWRGVVPDLVCRSPGEVLDIFLGRRDEQIEVDRLELIGAEPITGDSSRPRTSLRNDLRSLTGGQRPLAPRDRVRSKRALCVGPLRALENWERGRLEQLR